MRRCDVVVWKVKNAVVFTEDCLVLYVVCICAFAC